MEGETFGIAEYFFCFFSCLICGGSSVNLDLHVVSGRLVCAGCTMNLERDGPVLL